MPPTTTTTATSRVAPSVAQPHVAELWRYPVKSLRGERVEMVELTAAGIPGDRLVHVGHPSGRVVTSRTKPGLLGLQGSLDDDGEPLIEGLPWRDPAALAAVRAVAGETVDLIRDESLERFDILPLSILTDGAIAALGVDYRRLRPNLLLGGVEGLAERGWPGRRLRIGDAVIELVQLRPRCVMTTFDPDTLAQDHGVLRRIVAEFDGTMAIDAFVRTPGRVRVGDRCIVDG